MSGPGGICPYLCLVAVILGRDLQAFFPVIVLCSTAVAMILVSSKKSEQGAEMGGKE